MRKSTYELMNIEINKLDFVKDVLESPTAQAKLSELANTMRSILNEEYCMGSTNRKTCKTLRTNFVKNNPALLDAAQKIVDQPINVPLNISQLFADKYLRVVITFVKDKLNDFHYFTFLVGEERMLVKVSGTLKETEEHYEPTF